MRIKVMGLVTILDDEKSKDELYLVNLTYKTETKTVRRKLSVILVNNVTIKSHMRDEESINLVNQNWTNILTKILKYKGFK